jgi:cytochrome d ubiquinol oxidase subunit II
LGGVLFLLLFLVHGALWLAVRSEGEIHERADATARKLWPVLLVVAAIFLLASKFATNLYANYLAHPVLFAVILLAVLALLGTRVFLAKAQYWKAWFSSAVTILAVTFFGVIGLFPNLFPSSLDPAYSLTAHNASSSPLTLTIMLIVVLIFVPIVLAYQIWAYYLFRGKVKKEELAYEEAY